MSIQSMNVEDVRDRLRAEIKAVGTAGAWAKERNVSPQYVSDVLLGYRDPGDLILKAMGLEKIVTYQPKAD